jgi:hypothetical protein
VLVAHVLQKIFDCFGGLVGVDLDHEVTGAGGKANFGRLVSQYQIRYEKSSYKPIRDMGQTPF